MIRTVIDTNKSLGKRKMGHAEKKKQQKLDADKVKRTDPFSFLLMEALMNLSDMSDEPDQIGSGEYKKNKKAVIQVAKNKERENLNA